jgi:hypothetical protein
VIGAEVRPAAVLSEDGYPLCNGHAGYFRRRDGLECWPIPSSSTGVGCWACFEEAS